MRKCYSCKETKALKLIFLEDCDCHFNSVEINPQHSVCKNCFFEQCSCDEYKHLVNECLEDKECENHKRMVEIMNNWNGFDYYWKPKKIITVLTDGEERGN